MDEGTFGRIIAINQANDLMMPTLVLSSRGTLDSVKLRHAALESGWSVVRLLDVEQISQLKEQVPLVIFGEAIFARIVAASLGLYLLQPPLNWLTLLPAIYLKRDLVYMTLAEARCQREPAFIKPAGEKSFPAQIYTSGNQLPVLPDLVERTPVFVIEPVTWRVEYRCFVLEGIPATISVYKRDGQLARDTKGNWIATQTEIDEALVFCLEVVSDARFESPPAYVMDVGYIESRGWAVIETNPVWASGIYGCEPTAVLSLLRRSCRTTSDMRLTDMQWVHS